MAPLDDHPLDISKEWQQKFLIVIPNINQKKPQIFPHQSYYNCILLFIGLLRRGPAKFLPLRGARPVNFR